MFNMESFAFYSFDVAPITFVFTALPPSAGEDLNQSLNSDRRPEKSAAVLFPLLWPLWLLWSHSEKAQQRKQAVKSIPCCT